MSDLEKKYDNEFRLKILITGGNGQVGMEIKELCDEVGIDSLSVDIDDMDITNIDSIKRKMNDYFYEAQEAIGNGYLKFVINAAAYTAVDAAEINENLAYSINRDGVKNLAQCCKEFNVPLIHFSTDYVFSGENILQRDASEGHSGYMEDDAVGPIGVYGKSKLAGEETLRATFDKHIILRVSWVFGKYGNNFVKTMLKLARTKESINVVGDQRGCPTAARDIARVALKIVYRIASGFGKWGVYNYCGSPVTTWFDFAARIIEMLKSRFPENESIMLKNIHRISTLEYPTPAKRPKNSELCVNKITKDYFIKRHGWDKYLCEVINYLSSQN